MRLLLLSFVFAAVAAVPALPAAPPGRRFSPVSPVTPLISKATALKYAPVLYFHPWEKQFPCSMEHIMQHSTLKSNKKPSFSIEHPTGADLAKYKDDFYYLEIERKAFPGQRLKDKRVTAPMYVSTQHYPDSIAITYIFLYAYQPGMVFQLATPIATHQFMIESFGEHQGDLERVTVFLSKDQSKILKVNYAYHVDQVDYDPKDVEFEEGTHPVVYVGLNDHASYNPKAHPGSSVKIGGLDLKVAGATAVDLVAENRDGATWKPHKSTDPEKALVFVGIDDQGRAIGPNEWVLFKGHLAAPMPLRANHVLYPDGSPVPKDKQFIVTTAIHLFNNVIPASAKNLKGPVGFAARWFVDGINKSAWGEDPGKHGGEKR